eukprot:GHVN01083046.1.p2 GENE.GHVN01083046.1~~GHVN01083046.1.p2  ORF type:complete len:360 (+),score=60.45 GHVN01083046.1:3307-4386(+)
MSDRQDQRTFRGIVKRVLEGGTTESENASSTSTSAGDEFEAMRCFLEPAEVLLQCYGSESKGHTRTEEASFVVVGQGLWAAALSSAAIEGQLFVKGGRCTETTKPGFRFVIVLQSDETATSLQDTTVLRLWAPHESDPLTVTADEVRSQRYPTSIPAWASKLKEFVTSRMDRKVIGLTGAMSQLTDGGDAGGERQGKRYEYASMSSLWASSQETGQMSGQVSCFFVVREVNKSPKLDWKLTALDRVRGPKPVIVLDVIDDTLDECVSSSYAPLAHHSGDSPHSKYPGKRRVFLTVVAPTVSCELSAFPLPQCGDVIRVHNARYRFKHPNILNIHVMFYNALRLFKASSHGECVIRNDWV